MLELLIFSILVLLYILFFTYYLRFYPIQKVGTKTFFLPKQLFGLVYNTSTISVNFLSNISKQLLDSKRNTLLSKISSYLTGLTLLAIETSSACLHTYFSIGIINISPLLI